MEEPVRLNTDAHGAQLDDVTPDIPITPDMPVKSFSLSVNDKRHRYEVNPSTTLTPSPSPVQRHRRRSQSQQGGRDSLRNHTPTSSKTKTQVSPYKDHSHQNGHVNSHSKYNGTSNHLTTNHMDHIINENTSLWNSSETLASGSQKEIFSGNNDDEIMQTRSSFTEIEEEEEDRVTSSANKYEQSTVEVWGGQFHYAVVCLCLTLGCVQTFDFALVCFQRGGGE